MKRGVLFRRKKNCRVLSAVLPRNRDEKRPSAYSHVITMLFTDEFSRVFRTLLSLNPVKTLVFPRLEVY